MLTQTPLSFFLETGHGLISTAANALKFAQLNRKV